MTGDTQKTLFHPFETGDLLPPGKGQSVLFLGAEPGLRLPDGFEAHLSIVQGFRPYFRTLQAQGFEVAPRADGEDFDAALIMLGRHRGENEGRLWEALQRVKPGGLIVAAGDKKDGADSFRKRLAALLPLQGHASKFHGAVFWLRRPGGQLPAGLEPKAPAVIEGRFRTAPGMFSHDRIDPGSRLLAESLPGGIKGAVADFGAGWGYLAAILAERYPGITAVDLYEADFESLEAARVNLAAEAPSKNIGFFWRDLLSEPVQRRYDVIVMNPPFHQGRAAEPGIGQGMIRTAAAALTPGGALYLVANRGLPYEAVLAEAFVEHGEIARDSGFKVLRGRRKKR